MARAHADQLGCARRLLRREKWLGALRIGSRAMVFQRWSAIPLTAKWFAGHAAEHRAAAKTVAGLIKRILRSFYQR